MLGRDDLGREGKIGSLDRCCVKGILGNRKWESMGGISEGTFPSFPDSKRKGGKNTFEFCKTDVISLR